MPVSPRTAIHRVVQIAVASVVVPNVGVRVREWVSGKLRLDGISVAFTDQANPERHTEILVEPWHSAAGGEE